MYGARDLAVPYSLEIENQIDVSVNFLTRPSCRQIMGRRTREFPARLRECVQQGLEVQNDNDKMI